MLSRSTDAAELQLTRPFGGSIADKPESIHDTSCRASGAGTAVTPRGSPAGRQRAGNLGRNRRSLSARRDVHRDLSLDKIECQRLHPVVLALRPAILNDNVAAIEIADCKPRRKPAMRWVKGPADVVLRKPITGIAGCCALASIGNATDVAPSPAMNSRRLTRSPRRRVLSLQRNVACRTWAPTPPSSASTLRHGHV